jgi:hypothetical protein
VLCVCSRRVCARRHMRRSAKRRRQASAAPAGARRAIVALLFFCSRPPAPTRSHRPYYLFASHPLSFKRPLPPSSGDTYTPPRFETRALTFVSGGLHPAHHPKRGLLSSPSLQSALSFAGRPHGLRAEHHGHDRRRGRQVRGERESCGCARERFPLARGGECPLEERELVTCPSPLERSGVRDVQRVLDARVDDSAPALSTPARPTDKVGAR